MLLNEDFFPDDVEEVVEVIQENSLLDSISKVNELIKSLNSLEMCGENQSLIDVAKTHSYQILGTLQALLEFSDEDKLNGDTENEVQEF